MLLAFFVGINAVSAASTKVYVDPSNIMDSSLGVGDQFTVDVKIDDVYSLYGFAYKLQYDPAIISAESVTSSFLNEETMTIMNKIDNDVGTIWFFTLSLNPAEPKSGSGALATITFNVQGIGESTLDLYDTQLSDKNGNSIGHETEDGYFNNIPPATTTTPVTTTIYVPPYKPRPRGLLSTISSFFSNLFRF